MKEIIYPFSSTNWNQRPLGVQVLALAYRSGEAWNECAFNNAEFDEYANQFEAAKTLSEAVAASNAMEKILYDELPYVVLFNPPVLEVYRSDSISLPFTDVLGGITDACTGCASTVKKQS